MHSSYNLIKSANASINGDVSIVTECSFTEEEEEHYQEIENNQIKSYEAIGAGIISKARKDAEGIIMEAFKQSKDIEKGAYEKGYSQGMSNGYEDGSKQGYAEAKEKCNNQITEAVVKASEILANAELQIEKYKAEKEREIINLSLTMAKLIVNKEFQNDESIIKLITPLMEEFRGEENLVIRCHGNYIAAIEGKVAQWKKAYAISGEIFVLEDPLMELGNAVIEKSTGKIVVGIDITLKKIEEALKEFCGEEKDA